jgi:hypothetical protein
MMMVHAEKIRKPQQAGYRCAEVMRYGVGELLEFVVVLD